MTFGIQRHIDKTKMVWAIRRWMRRNAEDYSPNMGIASDINMTQLAEDCANALAGDYGQDPDEWLDDEGHIVWDEAFHCQEWWEAQFDEDGYRIDNAQAYQDTRTREVNSGLS